jgi:hypothetical protein
MARVAPRWFAVRTLYRAKALGKARIKSPSYDPDSTSLEERVVLFRAGSPKDALKQGRAEGLRYAREVQIVNAYGQKVRTKLLDRCETFDLFDQVVKSGTEVYSATRHVPKSVTDRKIALQLLGPIKIDMRAALKFADGDIMREAFQLISQR